MAETAETNIEDLFKGLDSILDGVVTEKGADLIDVDVDSTPTSVTQDTPKDVTKDGKTHDDGMIEIEDSNEPSTPPADETPETEEEAQTAQAEALKGFVTLLNKEGVFSQLDLEKFDGSVDGLKEAIYNEAKTMADERDNSHPAIIKYLIENYEEGVPLDKLINIKANEIRYSSIDTEKLKDDPALQKEIYKEYLKKTTGFNDAKIQKEISRLEDLEALGSEVEEAIPELIALEKKNEKAVKDQTKQEQADRAKRNEDTLKTIKTTTDSFKGKEIVPGIKLTDKETSSLYKALTTPVGYDENGAPISELQKIRAEDPIGFEIKLNYLVKMTKGFTDFSDIITKTKTAVAKQVEKAAEPKIIKPGKANINEEDSTNDIISAWSNLSKKFKNQ